MIDDAQFNLKIDPRFVSQYCYYNTTADSHLVIDLVVYLHLSDHLDCPRWMAAGRSDRTGTHLPTVDHLQLLIPLSTIDLCDVNQTFMNWIKYSNIRRDHLGGIKILNAAATASNCRYNLLQILVARHIILKKQL